MFQALYCFIILLVTICFGCCFSSGEETSPDNHFFFSRKTPSKNSLTTLQHSPNVQLKRLLATYEVLLNTHDSSIYFSHWSYDPKKNNITCSGKEREALLESFNHRLGLGFEDYIAKENRKTLRYKAVSPFANIKNSGIYNSKNPLRVNGELFSGILVGTHIQTGERLIEARFYKGIRLGEFKIWTNLGRLYQHSYGHNQVMKLEETVVRKPIIYLYPRHPQIITVKLDFKGEIIHSYPAYNTTTGWKVKANPDGTLVDVQTGKEYGYLFWEGKSNYPYQATTGFVVEGAATADFLDEKLAILGLNRAEATDFITYWLPELEPNTYNLIHFATTEYQKQAKLTITPQPKTIIRIFMIYQPLDYPIVIPKQELNVQKRQGFTVVEWGGKKAMNLWLPQ